MAGRKGAIAFGLVYIPVELFAATQDDAVRFNQLAKDSMKRVRYVKTCPDCKRELGPDDIVKGYQYEKGKYVVVTDEELESIKSEADRSMKIVQFADADEISPIFFEKPYQIVAQPGGERALELLRQAMLAENKVAIGTTVLGNSETPVAIMPYGDDLVMITLHYASEVKDIPKTCLLYTSAADADGVRRASRKAFDCQPCAIPAGGTRAWLAVECFAGCPPHAVCVRSGVRRAANGRAPHAAPRRRREQRTLPNTGRSRQPKALVATGMPSGQRRRPPALSARVPSLSPGQGCDQAGRRHRKR